MSPKAITASTTRRLVLQNAVLGLGALGLSGQAGAQAPFFAGKRNQFIFFEPRESAQALILQGFDGKPRPLAAHAGKSILLAFWASWCPPCRTELPQLARLQAESGAEPFIVLPVCLDRERANATRFLRQLGLEKLHSAFDPEGRIAAGPESAARAPFPLYGMPMAFILDGEGRKAGYLSGEADWSAPQARALLRYFAKG